MDKKYNIIGNMNGVSKYDLRIGNMFEQGIVFKISGRAGAKVHLHGKGKWYKGFRTEVAVEHLKPIVLSPQVLVEWCGFETAPNEFGGFLSPRIKNNRLRVCFDEQGCYGRDANSTKVYFNGLHELQNWYKGNTKQELEIKE